MNKDYTVFSEEERIKTHDDICDSIKLTYANKHHDYGPSFEKSYYEFGWIAPYVRMDDKMSRLKSLFSKGEANRKVSDESLYDTLIDLANYSIMLATELKLQHKSNKVIKVNNYEN